MRRDTVLAGGVVESKERKMGSKRAKWKRYHMVGEVEGKMKN